MAARTGRGLDDGERARGVKDGIGLGNTKNRRWELTNGFVWGIWTVALGDYEISVLGLCLPFV